MKRAIRAKYSPEERGDVRDRILSYLARAEKAKVGTIASELKEPVETLRYQLKVLRESKKVGMRGTRATAQWFQRAGK